MKADKAQETRSVLLPSVIRLELHQVYGHHPSCSPAAAALVAGEDIRAGYEKRPEESLVLPCTSLPTVVCVPPLSIRINQLNKLNLTIF